MENVQKDKNSVTGIKNRTGCFVDRETGKYFFTAPVLAMTPTRQSTNAQEKLALFLPAGNTCQAAIANSTHLKNESVNMYQALLGFDSEQVRSDLTQKLPRNDFFYNKSIDDSLGSRIKGDFWNRFGRVPDKNWGPDMAWCSWWLGMLKLHATRVGITDQVRLLAPDSSVNTIVDFSMNGPKDHDVWNTSTNDFENKFNNSMANVKIKNYAGWLSVRSFLYYQHWYVNDYGKLNTCFGDTSVESLRYTLLKNTDHYALSSGGSVYDFGFFAQNYIDQFKELFLLISCNKVNVNGGEVDLNKVDFNKLQDSDPIKEKVNELIDNLKNILRENSDKDHNYFQLYSDSNILYDPNTKRFAFVNKKGLDDGDASGWVYTMLMDIIKSKCPHNYQLRYDFFIGQDQINDWVQMPICPNGFVLQQGIARLNSQSSRFSFSQHLQRDRKTNDKFYTSLYKNVKENKDADKILKFIQNTFKFFDEYSIPPNMKEKLVFNEEETKEIEESAKNADYLAYFFKEEHLAEINKVIQKFNVSYTDNEKLKNKEIWLKNYYDELTKFLNRHKIGDILTKQGKKFFEAVRGLGCFNESEKEATIKSFQVTSNIICNFNYDINAIDFSLFNSLLDVKDTNSGSRKSVLLSKIRLYANYFFRNDNKDPFRTYSSKIGKLTKDAFSKECFEYFCKKETYNLRNNMSVLNELNSLKTGGNELKQKVQARFDDLMDNKLTKCNFREYLSESLREPKPFIINGIPLDDIDTQDLIQFLNSDDKKIKELISKCQKIMDAAYELKPEIRKKFLDGQYKEIENIYRSFYQAEFKTFKKERTEIETNVKPKGASRLKRIFLSNDVLSEIDDGVENALREFDKKFINKLVESACGKLGISKNEINNMQEQCIREICARTNFCVKTDFIEIFVKTVSESNGVRDFDDMLGKVMSNYKEINDQITKDYSKQDTLCKDIINRRENEEFKNVYLAWQFIQWMVSLVQMAVYHTCKNNPYKLARFKDNRHNLECHLRNGNFDRIMSNKDLGAIDNLISYLLRDCIAEKDKIKSITERVKLDLADIFELTSDSDHATQYNLLLMNKDGRKIKDGIFSKDSDTTTNALYFPIQSIMKLTGLCNNFSNFLSDNASNNMGNINQESTLWLDEKKYRMLDIDEFFWECTKRGEALKKMIANGIWNDIKFGYTLTKERREQAKGKNDQSLVVPLTLQEKQTSFDEFASLLRYDPLNLVSGSLQSDKSQSFILELLDGMRLNYFNNCRLGDFFDLLENVFLKKYKCINIGLVNGILESANCLDQYEESNLHEQKCLIKALRKNDSSTSDFGLQDGYLFKLSIDFIINIVKHMWIPDISKDHDVFYSFFRIIDNFALVFCKERENTDKNKRKKLVLLLYILHNVSTNVEKQKQKFNIVGDYENDDMKIEFCQTGSFNQFLQGQGLNNLLNLTQQFQAEVKEEEEQKQKDIEIQKELEKLKEEAEEKEKSLKKEKEKEKEKQDIDEQNGEKEKNEINGEQNINLNKQNNSDNPHIKGANKENKQEQEKEKGHKANDQNDNNNSNNQNNEGNINGEKNINQNEEKKKISEIQNNNKSISGNPKNRRIAEGVALILFVSLSILSRFIFPTWLLYIFIVGMLISGGLLGGNMWLSCKTNEEKNAAGIVSSVKDKNEEIDSSLEESQKTNNQNQDYKVKPNIVPDVETDVDNVNQNQVNLNDEREDK